MSDREPTQLLPLPASFGATREALRAVACFVLAPARKAATGRIGLRATGDGFGTPPFGDDGRRLLVRGDHLVIEAAGEIVEEAALSTVRAAAELAGVALSPDPGVGHDVPVLHADEPLRVDPHASDVLGRWYGFGDRALRALRDELGPSATETQLWPEHFDLAFDWGPDDARRANFGASPGDASSAEPYLYVGPWVRDRLDHPFWNAPFGAVLPYADLLLSDVPAAAAARFFAEGISLLW